MKYASLAGLLLCGGLMACATAEAAPEVETASTEAALVQEVAAVIVPVSDLEAATGFYTDVLSAGKIREMETKTYKERIMGFADMQGTKLVLIESKVEGASLKPVRIVFNTSRAADVVAAAKAKGVEIEREALEVPGAGMIIAILHDADGNTLEFIQR